MTTTDHPTTALDRLARHRATHPPEPPGQAPPEPRDNRWDTPTVEACPRCGAESDNNPTEAAPLVDVATALAVLADTDGRYLPVHVPSHSSYDAVDQADEDQPDDWPHGPASDRRRPWRSLFVIVPSLAITSVVAGVVGATHPVLAGLLLVTVAAMSTALLAAEVANLPRNN